MGAQHMRQFRLKGKIYIKVVFDLLFLLETERQLKQNVISFSEYVPSS